MNIWPEALILGGAAILAFLLMAIGQAIGGPLLERMRLLLSVILGVAVALLFYLAGLVDVAELTSTQAVARAVIAGITMAMAAFTTPNVLRTLRRG